MRLFVGLPVPASPHYAQVTRDLVDSAFGVRAVAEGTWHVTLRFLGNVPSAGPARAALARALDGAPALPCVVRGVGAFQSPRRARIAWAGVDAAGCDGLHRRVQDATAAIGEPPESRSFVPHVTLARLQAPQDVSAWVQRHAAHELARGVLDTVVLYESQLGGAGPRYGRVAEFPLARVAQA